MEALNVTNTGLQSLMVELTSSLTLTSIPTELTVPYETVTSVLDSAVSYQNSALSVIATATDSVSSISLINDILQAQATINYYSVLQSIATATATPSAAYVEAAQASAIMEKIFNENAFYSGNTPSFGGNLALLIVFSIMLAFQVLFGVFYHQWWFLSCWTSGLILEVLGYVGRVWSSQNIMNFNAYVMQLVALTLAPCFLMAGIYYIIAQLTMVYGQKFSVMRPMAYSMVFIICDLISIVLQAAGGGMASSALSLFEETEDGSHVMVGGLAFQVFTIGIFQLFWYLFLYRIYQSYKKNGDSEFNPKFVHVRERKFHFIYLGSVSLAVLLVFVRSIYRLVELSEGWSSDLAVDEIYFMILEALMMALASFLMTVVHPGIAYGRNAHLYIDKSPRAIFSKRYNLHHAQKDVDEETPNGEEEQDELEQDDSFEKPTDYVEPENEKEKKSSLKKLFKFI